MFQRKPSTLVSGSVSRMFLSVASAFTLELFEFHERKLTGVMMVLAWLRKLKSLFNLRYQFQRPDYLHKGLTSCAVSLGRGTDQGVSA